MAKYRHGDIVRVLDLEDITRQFRNGRHMASGCFFPKPMEEYCGHQFYIEEVLMVNEKVGYYKLSGIEGWNFTDEMLELAYDPKEDLKEIEIKFSFEDLMIN